MTEKTCQQCEEWIQEVLDGAPFFSSPEFEAHLGHCAPCRHQVAAARQMLSVLTLLPSTTPPPDLASRIVTRVRTDATQRRRLRWTVAVAVGLAASLLLVFFAAWTLRPGSGPAQNSGIAQGQPETPPPPSVPDEQPSLRENVVDATSAVATLSRRTADDALGGAQLLIPPVSLPMPEEVPPPLESPTQALLETGHGASVSLQPVTNSAKRAFGLFVRDLPPMNPAEKSGL